MASQRYIQKFSKKLFPNPVEQEQFVEALAVPNERYRHKVILAERGTPLSRNPMYSMLPTFVRSIESESTSDSGYICDLSSPVLTSAVTCLDLSNTSRILDLCASPGGKSIFCSLLFTPRPSPDDLHKVDANRNNDRTIYANETISSRLPALISNFSRCRLPAASITSSDSSFFASQYSNAFELVIVDAPCSGQSMRAKGVDVRDCFHPLLIERNANRQKRILANAIRATAPGGYILYLTCTFSPEENEDVISWGLRKFPELCAIANTKLLHLQSLLTDSPCYRLYPWQGLGVGGFAALLKKEGELPEVDPNPLPLHFFWSSFAGEK